MLRLTEINRIGHPESGMARQTRATDAKRGQSFFGQALVGETCPVWKAQRSTSLCHRPRRAHMPRPACRSPALGTGEVA